MSEQNTPPVVTPPAAKPAPAVHPPKLSPLAEAQRQREVAEAKVEAAKRLLADAEAELKKDWKSGSSFKLRFNVPKPEFGSPPSINGKKMVGMQDLTYDEHQEVMRALSFRKEHESRQRYGYHQGEKYIRLSGSAAALKLVL